MTSNKKPKEITADLQPVSWDTWKQVFKLLSDRIARHQVLIIAGGVAFYFFLSVFPGLAAIITIYGMFTDASALDQQMAQLAGLLPGEAQELIRERLEDLVQNTQETLGWQLAIGAVVSIWITNVGTRALFRGVNIAYGSKGKRKAGREIGLTLIFTIGGIIFYILALVLTLAYPVVAGEFDFSGFIQQILVWLKWPLLALILVGALILVYRFAPVDRVPRYRRIAWGAGVAALLWVLGSWILAFVVGKVGVAPSYGPLAAVAILMLWFLLSSFVIIVGAEINSLLEQMATGDTSPDDDVFKD